MKRSVEFARLFVALENETKRLEAALAHTQALVARLLGRA